MKKLLSIFVAVFGLSASVVVATETPAAMSIAPLSDDLEVVCHVGYAPKENAANPAGQSATWNSFASNWLDILRSGAGSSGSGFDLAQKRFAPDYAWMATSSSFRSWNLGLTTEQQFGNRVIVSLDVRSLRTNVTFKPSQIGMNIRSYDHMNESVRWQPDVINATASFATSNYFRLRMEAGTDGILGTSDDVLAGSQDLSQPTRMFRYGGLMAAIGAFGSGDAAQQLQNVLTYYEDTHSVLRLVVTVPYTDGSEGVKTLQTSVVLIPTGAGLESRVVDMPLTMDLAHNRVHMGDVGNAPEPNRLYQVEQSSDLNSWTPVFYPDLGRGEITPFKIDGTLPRNFFRVREFSPAAPSMMLRTPRGPPQQAPKDDSVAL